MKRLLVVAALALLAAGAAAGAPAGPQCSDGIDNDRDGIVDWIREPGCSSAKDPSERTPLSCEADSAMRSGRLSITGECSGAFSKVEYRLLDGVQLNGRYDVQHAPACAAPTATRVRCTAKEADRNPKHMFSAQLSTTSKDPKQRAEVRFVDAKGRVAATAAVGSATPKPSDLSVQATVTPTFSEGETARIRVVVRNAGPARSPGAKVTLRFSTHAANGGVTYEGKAEGLKPNGETWTFTVMGLEVGDSAALTATFEVFELGSQEVTAIVHPFSPDPNTANNRDSAIFQVER